jgi:pimeloyl-ACP methyl ester carboxylesterase
MSTKQEFNVNRRSFLKTGVFGIGAFAAGSQTRKVFGEHDSEIPQPGCDGCVCIDDHQFGFRVFGSADPIHHVFFFHGMPVSRVDGARLHHAAVRKNVQIISVDRPGLGLSSYQENRTLISTAKQYHQIAKKLKFDHSYSIIGHSFGTIAASACGRCFSAEQGLKKLALVAPFAPNWMSHANSRAGNYAASLIANKPRARRIIRVLRHGTHSRLPTSRYLVRRGAVRLLPKADNDYIDSDLVVQSMGQCVTQGPDGPMKVVTLGMAEWGFKLDEIPQGDRFTIWQGEEDDFTPVEVGRFFAEGNECHGGIKNSHYKERPCDGHYSILHTKGDEIIDSVLP